MRSGPLSLLAVGLLAACNPREAALLAGEGLWEVSYFAIEASNASGSLDASWEDAGWLRFWVQNADFDEGEQDVHDQLVEMRLYDWETDHSTSPVSLRAVPIRQVGHWTVRNGVEIGLMFNYELVDERADGTWVLHGSITDGTTTDTRTLEMRHVR